MAGTIFLGLCNTVFAGGYVEELGKKKEVQEVRSAIIASLAVSEAKAISFREQFLRFSHLWTVTPAAALQVAIGLVTAHYMLVRDQSNSRPQATFSTCNITPFLLTAILTGAQSKVIISFPIGNNILIPCRGRYFFEVNAGIGVVCCYTSPSLYCYEPTVPSSEGAIAATGVPGEERHNEGGRARGPAAVAI